MGDRGNLGNSGAGISPNDAVLIDFTNKLVTGEAIFPSDIAERLDKESLKSTLGSFLYFRETYPNLWGKYYSTTIITYDASGDAFASTNGVTLNLNPNYFGDDEYMNAAYQETVDSHFHPDGTTFRNVVDHEIGHILVWRITEKIIKNSPTTISDRVVAWEKNRGSDLILNTAYMDIKNNPTKYGFANAKAVPKKKDLVSQISEYAEKNSNEAIAEAVAMSRGTKSTPLSRAISNLLQQAETDFGSVKWNKGRSTWGAWNRYLK